MESDPAAAMVKYRARLVFLDRAVEVDVGSTETILEAARRQGIDLLSDCTLGVCGTCKALCVEGKSKADGIDPQGLTILEAKRGYVLTCQSSPCSDLVLKFSYDSQRCKQSGRRTIEAVLTHCALVSEAVVRFELRVTDSDAFTFRPGQYVNIKVPGTSERRSFSCANPPDSGSDLEFFARILPDGVMSNYLRERARPGDRLEVTGVFGDFFLREPRRPILMIAGGTGLAPMLSMLGHLGRGGASPQPVHLLYGTNRRSEIFGRDRLEEYRRVLDRFEYEVSVTEPEPDWKGARGFVTGLLREELLRPGGLDVYLCGPPAMIEAGISWLAGHGVPPEDIHCERFLPSGGSGDDRASST